MVDKLTLDIVALEILTVFFRLVRFVCVLPARLVRRSTDRAAVLLAIGLWVFVVFAAEPFGAHPWSSGIDAHPYWAASLSDPYLHSVVGTWDAYLYSPVFLQILTPLRMLPWQVFLGIWAAVLLVALYAITGRRRIFWALLFFGWWDLMSGNISYLLALVAVAGFTRPALWAIPALTKVTPILGAAWFALRGEWRALAQLGLVIIGLVAASVLIGGIEPWRAWVATLVANATAPITTNLSFPVPFAYRLPFAAGLLIYAAHTDRRWLMPVVVVLALPVIWWGGFSILLAVPALRASERERVSARIEAGTRADRIDGSYQGGRIEILVDSVAA